MYFKQILHVQKSSTWQNVTDVGSFHSNLENAG